MPVIHVIIAAVLWGVIGPLSQLAFKQGVSPLEVAFWRSVVASSCFLVHSIAARKRFATGKDLFWMAMFGIFSVALLEASHMKSVESGGSAFSAIMLYSAPAWVAIFSRLIFREKLPSQKLLAVIVTLIGVGGVALAGGDQIQFSSAAIMWGLWSGLSYACFYIAGKFFLARHSPEVLYGISFTVASVALWPLVEFQTKNSLAWIAIISLGIVCTYLPYWFYGRGLAKLDATKASVIACLEPVVAAIAAWVIWSEKLSLWGYVFGLSVLVGILLMVRRSTPKSCVKSNF